MNNNSMLIPLHNLANSQDENFVTEVLVYTLNFFSIYDQKSFIKIIKLISNGQLKISIENLNNISITTQINTTEGRPDIKIETKDQLIYVEVKVDSDFGHNQITRYKKALSLSPKKTMLLTITRYHYLLHNPDQTPDFGLRWHQLSDWIMSLELSHDVSRFVRDQFIMLLEKRGLAMKEISWQLKHGITDLINIVDLIGEALAGINITQIKKSSGWDWRGYYVQDQFFVGLYFNQPDLIILNSEVALSDNKPEEPALGRYEGYGSGWQNSLDLYSEEVHFFSRSKTSQLEYLENFLKESLSCGKNIIKTTT